VATVPSLVAGRLRRPTCGSAPSTINLSWRRWAAPGTRSAVIKRVIVTALSHQLVRDTRIWHGTRCDHHRVEVAKEVGKAFTANMAAALGLHRVWGRAAKVMSPAVPLAA